MAIDFLSSRKRDQRAHERDDYPGKKKGVSFFLWTILIVLMVALNAGIWTFSLMVFGYPEKPFNYRLLTKLEKLEPIKKFPALSAPKGKFHTPQQIYEAFYAHSPQHLNAINALLRREYIRNYEDAKPVFYLRGTFRVYQVRELTKDDFFPSGIVLRAIYQDYPQVIIEYVMPMDEVPQQHFAIGDDLDIDAQGSSAFAALINVEKLRDYKICFTLVPLVYGAYGLPNGESIRLSPPARLVAGASFPITDEAIGEPEPALSAAPAPAPPPAP